MKVFTTHVFICFGYDVNVYQPFLNMSSNSSAGPLFVDYSSNYLFFMDLHPHYPFIGKVSLDLADPGTTATYVRSNTTYII